MPNKVTVKLEFKFDGGPTVKPKDQEIWVQSYTPNSEWIDSNKEWHSIPVDARDRNRLEFLLINLKEPPGNGNGAKCPEEKPVLFKFGKKPGEQADPTKDIFELNAPQFFAGNTIGLLPEPLEWISFQNHRSAKVEVEILLAKKTEEAMKPKPPLIHVIQNQQTQKP
jgi:hypothetical protein